jgi:hypothetical protein
MILHIVLDEKFIDAAYRAFEEAYPGNNEFVILSKKHPLRYIKKTPIRFVERAEFWGKKFANSLMNYDLVVLHWLDDAKMQLLDRADQSVKFVWIGWGGDYYDLIAGDDVRLLKPKTSALRRKYQLLAPSLSFKSKIKQVIKRAIYKKIDKRRSVQRINFFAPVLYEDYELLLCALPDFAPRYLPWNYGTLEDDMVKGFQDHVVSGDSILIGNSATYENNHVDIFDDLSSFDLDSRHIICPLSYGDQQYREVVIKAGVHQFGKKFMPITDFMSIEKYVQLLSSCSSVVMGHLRQQALGNIVIMIYLGAKVFLDKNNPVYQFFRKEGAIVFVLEQIGDEINTPLMMDQIEHNRMILRKYWSRDVIRQKTTKLITTVMEG